MIHLANSNQISMQSPYQTLAAQPPAQIPNPYPNYTQTQPQNQNQNQNTNNNTNQNNRRNNGKRLKRDDDWDICWDYLSPKGCNRDTCRWRHGNPTIDQRQIAKRRKRYMEQNRRGDNNHRNNNNNRYKRRKKNNNSNIWGHHHPQMMHGPPPPPPYFAPPPQGMQGQPQLPPPPQGVQGQNQVPAPVQGQTPQDYYAQYYAAYGYMQPPPQNQPQGKVAIASDQQQTVTQNKDKKDGVVSTGGYGQGQYPYGYYGGYPYPYGVGYPPPYGYNPGVPPVKGKEEEKKKDDVVVGKVDGNVVVVDDKVNDKTEVIEVNNDKVLEEAVPSQVTTEIAVENNNILAKENGVESAHVAVDADEDIDLNNKQLLSSQPSAGKQAIECNVLNKDKDEVMNNLSTETENKNKNVNININKNEKLSSSSPSASPPRTCPYDCTCDVCSYKQTFQQPETDNNKTINPPNPATNPEQKTENKPKRHPMFDGMDYKNIDQDLSSDDDDDDDSDIDITNKQSQSQSNPWNLWHEQYQNYTKPTTTNTTTTTTVNPQQILAQAQKNAFLAQQALQKTLQQQSTKKTKKKKSKKKSKKKKGIESTVKWLYIISDSDRECYGSLCRGQFDNITTTKWLTSLYESADWGVDVKDRSRSAVIMDGPTSNHIAWYTLSGCNCTLINDVQSAENANIAFPLWLQQITNEVMKICSCERNAPNSCEIFYFENKSSRWNWHSYCQDEVFGLNNGDGDGGVCGDKHVGQTIHLLVGHRRQFKFAPRKTMAVPGDEEKSVFLENGDVFVTCGKFTSDYVVKIDCEEEGDNDNMLSKAHSSMYIVWRWIVKHNDKCVQKQNF